MKKVLATGVFDILHPGHIYFLTQAKKWGDHLTVLVASDPSAQKQGKKPVFSQNERLELIKNLRVVDKAVAGRDEADRTLTVQKLQPRIIALGFDQKIDEKKLAASLRQDFGWQGRVVRIAPMPQSKVSSRKIKTKIKNDG